MTETTFWFLLLWVIFTLVWTHSRRLRESTTVFILWFVLLGVVIKPMVPHIQQGVEWCGGMFWAEIAQDMERDYPELFR